MLQPLLRGLKEAGLTLRWIRADGLERHNLRNMTTCGGYCGCDYCLARGTYCRVGRKVVWTFALSHNVERRTVDGWRAILDNLDNLDKEDRMGVKGYSSLIDLDGFNLVWDLPIDSFHNVEQGILKQMMTKIFTKPKDTESREYVKELNAILLKTKVPFENSRRTRAINTVAWKQNEWSNIGLFISVSFFTPDGILRGEV
jgi:hypothetical protein